MTANYSLASMTWKTYGSRLRSISKMEEELGIRLIAPLDETMILTVLAILIKRCLKTSTMRGYVCPMQEEQIAKGYSTNLAKVILKGKSNQEATSPKVERAGISVELMK